MLAETEPKTNPVHASKPRLDFLDVAKAIGILCVIALHSFGRSARELAIPGSPEQWALILANRLFAFAVPMFLCISAFLWARSQRSKERLFEGYRRRILAILHPYLVWTLIFMVWSIAVEKASPAGFRSFHTWWNDLLWGKAFFHLYFLSILVQAALLFPLMYLLIKRLNFFAVCAVAFTLQAVVFWSQTHWQYLVFPGSSVLWYITSLLPAAWLGYRWPISNPSLKKLAIGSFVVTVLSVLPYLWLQILDLDKIYRFSGLSNPIQQVFVFGTSFWLISFLALKPATAKPWMVWLGAVSLQFYLLHPMLMRLTSGPHILGLMKQIPGGSMVVYVLILAFTVVAVWVLNKLKLERILFGRSSPPLPKRPDQTSERRTG